MKSFSTIKQQVVSHAVQQIVIQIFRCCRAYRNAPPREKGKYRCCCAPAIQVSRAHRKLNITSHSNPKTIGIIRKSKTIDFRQTRNKSAYRKKHFISLLALFGSAPNKAKTRACQKYGEC
ncbi:MAG: hypothetical protein Q4A11_04705 [Brachymonas sp.]|nr:hypothetical protein [Brachymonas sp.]